MGACSRAVAAVARRSLAGRAAVAADSCASAGADCARGVGAACPVNAMAAHCRLHLGAAEA